MKIIDFHGHCGIQHNTQYHVHELLDFITGSPVVKMVVSSLSGIFNADYAEEDLLLLQKYSVFVPSYWVNPYQKNWQERFQALRAKIPLSCIKLHPTANIYKPTTEFLKPVFEFCRNNRLFITIHTDTFNSSPMQLTELLLDFPDVNVVLIHMDDPINSIFLASKFKNVYLETSWIERKWENLAPVKIALDCVENHKIFFGSDFPYEFPILNHEHEVGSARSYEGIIEQYCELLPSSAAEQILFSNARNFLEGYGIIIHA